MKINIQILAAVVVAVGVAGGTSAGSLAMTSTTPGGAGSGSSAKSDYSAAERAVRAKQYKKAIARLQRVVAKEPRNVDALNYLGYSHRQLGQYRQALGYYRLALKIDPDHRGANEYLGQLYLKMGDMKRAKAQLARLRKMCPGGCEEYDSLRDALVKKGVKI